MSFEEDFPDAGTRNLLEREIEARYGAAKDPVTVKVGTGVSVGAVQAVAALLQGHESATARCVLTWEDSGRHRLVLGTTDDGRGLVLRSTVRAHPEAIELPEVASARGVILRPGSANPQLPASTMYAAWNHAPRPDTWLLIYDGETPWVLENLDSFDAKRISVTDPGISFHSFEGVDWRFAGRLLKRLTDEAFVIWEEPRWPRYRQWQAGYSLRELGDVMHFMLPHAFLSGDVTKGK
ncbi:MAG: hypothetical protein PF961_07710 [Planctomycetota bacterium]|nr:hypothetical protein [Planctomycetota bacterium]